VTYCACAVRLFIFLTHFTSVGFSTAVRCACSVAGMDLLSVEKQRVVLHAHCANSVFTLAHGSTGALELGPEVGFCE
jgi:hypothetical protein